MKRQRFTVSGEDRLWPAEHHNEGDFASLRGAEDR